MTGKYYLITENFFNNNSSLITDDRTEYFCELDSPITSIANEIQITEETSIKLTRDFHFIGEIVCNTEIANIISQFNPYLCHFLPAVITDKENENNNYHLLSLSNVFDCADLDKSDIMTNPFYPDSIMVNELYLDLELLNSLPEHKRQLFIIKETPDRIIVSKALGEKLLDYRSKAVKTSLIIKPVSDDGRVPEIM